MGHMLGAQGVVRGTLAKVGESFQVDVRVYQASDGKVIATQSVSARNSEGLVRALDLMAVEISRQVKKAFGVKEPEPEKRVVVTTPTPPLLPPTPAPPPPPPPLDLRTVAWAPAVGGIAAAAIGGGLLGFAQYERGQVSGGTLYFDKALEARRLGELSASVGTGLLVAGGVALAVGAGFRFLGAPQTAVTVSPGPAGATLEVRFP
jgi:hypothetical protein